MRVMFHGYLRDMVPPGIETIDFAVKTVKECVEAVSIQIPAFNKGPRKVAQIVGVRNEHDLLREDMKVVHVVPAFIGGKRGGFFQILLGGILIAAAFIPGLGVIAGVALKTILLNAGLALALGGIASLIAPKPPSNAPSAQNPEGSKYLGAQGNTVKIGTRIPLGYGRQKVYGHILSFNVTSQTLADRATVSASGAPVIDPVTGKPVTSSRVKPSNPLSLSQGSVNLPIGKTRATLARAQGGTAPYTYTLDTSSPLRFTPSSRSVTISISGEVGGQICRYKVTDGNGDSVSVTVAISYDSRTR